MSRKTLPAKLFTYNGKPLQVSASMAFNDHYDNDEKALIVIAGLEALVKHPVDMFVIDGDGSNITVRSAGYGLDGSELDEKTIVVKQEQLFPVRKCWLKIDDYGDHYIGTFLFPEDY